MGDNDLCLILNETNTEDQDNDQIATMSLIIVPLITSLIAQSAVLASACRQRAKGSRWVLVHETVVITLWIVIASIWEANQRLGFFLSPRSETGMQLMCKAMFGFAPVALQVLAVLTVIDMAVRIKGDLVDNFDSRNTCKKRIVGSWIAAAAIGAAVAAIYQAGCFIFVNPGDEAVNSEHVVTCSVGSNKSRLLFSCGRLIVMVILPLCFLIFRICTSAFKLKCNSVNSRRQSILQQEFPHLSRLQYEQVDAETVRFAQIKRKRRNQSGNIKNENKALRFLFFMTAAFLICWAPIHVLKLLQSIAISNVQFPPGMNVTGTSKHGHEIASGPMSADNATEPVNAISSDGLEAELTENMQDVAMDNMDNVAMNATQDAIESLDSVEDPVISKANWDLMPQLNHEANLSLFYDSLEPYLFCLWVLHPAFLAMVQFWVRKHCR